MTETTSRNNPAGLTFGLVAGLALCVFNLFLYLGGIETYMSQLNKLGYLIVGATAVWAALRVKKQQGGYLSFSEALKVLFAVFALAFLLQTFFNFILFNYIDVPFRDAVTQAVIDDTTKMMKRLGANEEQIDDLTKNAADPRNYRLSSMMLGYAFLCILFFVVSLIIALIIRKKRPPFENTFNQ